MFLALKFIFRNHCVWCDKGGVDFYWIHKSAAVLLNSWICCATDLHTLTLEHWEQDLLQSKSQWCSHFSAEHCPESCALVFTAFPDDFPGWAEMSTFLAWLTHDSICWITHAFREERTHSRLSINTCAQLVHIVLTSVRGISGWDVAASLHENLLLTRWICVRVLTYLFSRAHHLPRCRDLCSRIWKGKRSHRINTRKNKHALCVRVCVVSSIIHTTVFSFWGTKGTSQHNTAGAQYTLSNPPHFPLAVLLLFFLLSLFSSFSSASPPPLLLPVVFPSLVLVLLVLL